MKARCLQITGFLVVVASLPYWLISTQSFLSIAVLTLLFAGAATAYNLVGGLSGQLSFGHSIFLGLGAYATALTRQDLGWNPWYGAALGVALAVAAALLMALPSVRLAGVYFVLVTYVATLTLEQVAVWAGSLTGGAAGVSIPLTGSSWRLLSFGPVGGYYLAAGLLAVILVVAVLVDSSSLGLFARAVRDDRAAASAAGVRVVRAKITVLVISAALTSLVGVAYVQYTSFIDPSSAFGSMVAISIAMPAVFGGLRAFWGPVLGAAILIPVQQTLNPAFSGLPAGVGLLLFGLLIVAVQTTEPRGASHLVAATATALNRRRVA
ncbi:branched-chain amino acid ABC transporter permease [Actinoallomurus bryophytorum]|uniref:Amino acid/amide ABC transporter membrane protein 2 (HAAT family) n=1 Tax=Actinoallomurus bryophytorum TaxID=1490222 RepID=A0A543C1K1_9ACTN|nr:branched-chain amino acid ABC transporter permease [Actinoallomurus bryophytorum]TQL90944.1 amino acid/amide ABC transporter membrane protein 2 (HAAT family) [Actinoallomurus bryophytorum]